jgi:hypothetical protein
MHDGRRLTRQAFSESLGRFLARDLADSKGMVTDDGIPGETDIGLCRALIRFELYAVF